MFKTKVCDQEIDANGHCVKFGRHCAKAHGENDKRIPFNRKQYKRKETYDQFTNKNALHVKKPTALQG